MTGSLSLKIKNICVFCGSSPWKEKEFIESTNYLDQILIERKIHLVYGGGSLGLMGSVSTAASLSDGLGTFEEIFHIFSRAQLHIHHKPISLLNVNGFYDNLLSFLDQAVEQ